MKTLGVRRRISLSLLYAACLSLPGVGGLVVVKPTTVNDDLDVVTRQLGYRPTNFGQVSARNRDGIPIAIQTYPLEGGARRRQTKARKFVKNSNADDDKAGVVWLGTPFPTLYWLTCPDINKCIANLERQGLVKQILEQELLDQADMAAALRLAHADYARRRWASLTDDDRQQLKTSQSPTMQRMRDMLECSGIAGSNLTATTALPTIKCLHTHYAHYRSVVDVQPRNPVGARVHEILTVEYPDLVL